VIEHIHGYFKYLLSFKYILTDIQNTLSNGTGWL